MQPINPNDAAVVAGMRVLSRHLGDLMEQVGALVGAIEHRDESPQMVDLALADLRNMCVHTPLFTGPEGRDHA